MGSRRWQLRDSEARLCTGKGFEKRHDLRRAGLCKVPVQLYPDHRVDGFFERAHLPVMKIWVRQFYIT